MYDKKKLYSVIILILVLIICSSFPFALFKLNEDVIFYLSNGLRLAFLIFAFIYIKKNDLNGPRFNKLKVKDLAFLPFFIICFSNFIFIWISNLPMKDYSTTSLVYSCVSCVFVSLCEELVFRTVLLMEFRSRKSAFLSILFSSLIFGGCHLLNISSLDSIVPCLIQAVYTTGIGFVLGLMYLETKNYILVFIFHLAFNLLNNSLSSGLYDLEWNSTFFIVNGVVAGVGIIYWIILYLSKDKIFKFDL